MKGTKITFKKRRGICHVVFSPRERNQRKKNMINSDEDRKPSKPRANLDQPSRKPQLGASPVEEDEFFRRLMKGVRRDYGHSGGYGANGEAGEAD